jgi:phage shock protein PspC (stress-responsive transcriptional regulator)
MNKVFNINLGGYTFTIDEDAYYHLKQYLEAIDSHFKNSEGFEDITTDIEIRLSELFQEKLKGRQIVNIKDVSEAINIMGTPEDFGATSDYSGVPEDDMAIEGQKENTYSKAKKDWSKHKFGKRLYRNSDETIVGGVASGISAYLGMEDPIWVRLLMAITIIFGGVSFVFYIILWAILPEAKTPKQKLEMRGERIDVNNIAKTVEEEVKNVANKLNDLSGSGKKKKNGKEQDDEMSYGSNDTVKQGIEFVRQTSKGLEQLVRTVLKPLLFIIGIGLMISVGGLWIALIVGSVLGYPYLAFLLPSGQVPVVSTLAFMAVSIPIIGIALTVIRLFFGVKIWKAISASLTILLIGAVSILFYYLTITAREFDAENQVSEVTQYPQLKGDVIEIDVNTLEQTNSKIQFGHAKIINSELVHRSVYLNFKKAEGDVFELKQTKFARGLDGQSAKVAANNIKYTPSAKENVLNLDEFIKHSKTQKWRNQRVELELSIPVGKSVQLSDELQDMIHHIHLDAKNGRFYSWQLNNAIIKAEADGWMVSGFSGEPHSTTGDGHYSEYKDFSEITLDGNLKVYIDKGDNFEFRAQGEHHHNGIEVSQNGKVLSIQGSSNDDKTTKVYITLPSLSKVTANDAGDVWVRNFEQAAMEINISGETEVRGEGLNVQYITTTLKNDAELRLKGSGKKIEATILEDAKLDADEYNVGNAKITGRQDANIRLNVSDTLSGTVESDVNMKLEAQPRVNLLKKN